MKKILAIALALVTVICLFAACGANGGTKGPKEKEEIKTFDNYEYTVLEAEDGTQSVKITKYLGTDTIDELKIFDTIEGIDVTVIGESAFEGSTGLSRVDLPLSLVTIEDRAFASSSVKSIHGESCAYIETVGKEAFKDCAGLIQFDIKAVKTIGKDAFAGCAAFMVFTVRTDAELSADSFGDARNCKFVIHEDCANLVKFAEDNGHEIQYF